MNDKLNKYVFLFEAVFQHEEIAGAFQKFLKKEFSFENYEFVSLVEKLSKMEKESEMASISIQIFNEYILMDSPKEINIPSEVRKTLVREFTDSRQLEDFSTWLLQISPQDLFQEAKESIRNTLRFDSFKRFIRSSEYLSIVVKHLDNTKVAAPALSYDFNYKDEDFHYPFTTQNDFDFINVLMQDGFDWGVLGVKSEFDTNLTSYFSKVNYLSNCKFAQKHTVNPIKYETVFNYPFHQVLALLSTESVMSTDPNTTGILYEGYFEQGEKVSRDHDHVKISLSFPMLDYRTCPVTTSTDYNAKEHRVIQLLR